MSCVTTTSALANAASVAALSPASQSKMWLSVLPSMSSRMTGASGIEGSARVDDRRQRLVFDVDQLERVARGVAVVGDDEGDLLALEPHFVGGQHGQDVMGQRRHPGEIQRLEQRAGDHRLDLGMRLGRLTCRSRRSARARTGCAAPRRAACRAATTSST